MANLADEPIAPAGDKREAARRSRLRGLLFALVTVVLVVAVTAVVVDSRALRERSSGAVVELNQPAPSFELSTLDGERLTLADLEGQPVWLNFWATWCQPCRAEMPDLALVGEEAAGVGVRLIAVDVGESPEEVRGYLRRAGLEGLPVAMDADARTAGAYRAFGFPVHVFIGSDGRVRALNYGPMDAAAMRRAVAELN